MKISGHGPSLMLRKPYDVEVSIWSNSGWVTSIIRPTSPIIEPVIQPDFGPEVRKMTTIDDLLGLSFIVPLQIGSGILDYNGVELKSVLPPTSTLLGDYLERYRSLQLSQALVPFPSVAITSIRLK